jgi:hypothetical protein
MTRTDEYYDLVEYFKKRGMTPTEATIICAIFISQRIINIAANEKSAIEGADNLHRDMTNNLRKHYQYIEE